MKRVCLVVGSLLFILSACEKAVPDDQAETVPVVSAISNVQKPAVPSPASDGSNQKETSRVFLAKSEEQLSFWDFETAYAMCTSALSDYYHAVWTGSNFDLDAYFVNGNLKEYTQNKIAYEYGWLGKQGSESVTGIDFGAEKIELVSKGTSYFYLKLPVHVEKYIGAFAEPTEFLVQNHNGRLVIADWYTNRKDSYDFTARGGIQTINNPEIWHDDAWVKKLKVKTNE